MTTKHSPATPLPWQAAAGGKDVYWLVNNPTEPYAAKTVGEHAEQDAAYIAHACNAYPTLVERIRNSLLAHDEMDDDDGNGPITCTCQQCGTNRALLRSLGEDA